MLRKYLLHPLLAATALSLSIPALADTQEQTATDPATENAAEQVVDIQQELPLQDLRTFTEIFERIRSSYVEEIDDHTLFNNAIKGMLSSLDPHSA
ncbi:MAG: peptidase S41, partial [Thalassolituus sp.]